MKFQRKGNVFVCLSPFGEEKNPSFVIHQKQGQWLFKDFSSDKGGSIIDLVRELENLPNHYPTIAARIERLLGQNTMPPPFSSASATTAGRTDLAYVFKRIRANDRRQSKDYLASRAISEKVINRLVKHEQLFTNLYKDKTYCCFAVRDPQGRLMCLDNHQIYGPDKFVLGNKHVFIPDYQALFEAGEITITEGIIDLLSMQTLFSCVGLALLGNRLDFPAQWLSSNKKLVLALDNDKAGDAGKQKLRKRFPENHFEDFSVGDYKDPNEMLTALLNLATKRKKYSAEEKLKVCKEPINYQNNSGPGVAV
jgi:DNA primase